jgi:cysteinyl-tRNA synthetase
MSNSYVSNVNNKTGLCPHGLPPAACPICSGGSMSGGRIKDNSPATKPINTGEWSFMKCYAAGLALKAQEVRIENAKNVFEMQIEFSKQLAKNIQNITDKIQNTLQNLKDISPNFLKSTIQIISNVIINPILNLISQIPKIIEKFTEFQQKFAMIIQNAGEKLVAILGDIKNFINKKILEDLKKKAKNIFSFFVSNTEDENYKNDDTLAVFKSRELKKYIVKILKKRKNNADRGTKGKAI